jgi:hypothetical protein
MVYVLSVLSKLVFLEEAEGLLGLRTARARRGVQRTRAAAVAVMLSPDLDRRAHENCGSGQRSLLGTAGTPADLFP